MKKGFYYFLFVAFIMGGMMLYFKIDRQRMLKNPMLSDIATEPDLLMGTADMSFHEDKHDAAIKYLDEAIRMMKVLEKEGDTVTVEAIEVAIHDLEVVEIHIKDEDISDDLMYEAFADAMNSLAFASLSISEEFIREGKKEKAKITIDHAMDHLQNSIYFARGEQKKDEIKIAGHLQRIIENHWENDISEIHYVMQEIDSVVKAHVIE